MSRQRTSSEDGAEHLLLHVRIGAGTSARRSRTAPPGPGRAARGAAFRAPAPAAGLRASAVDPLDYALWMPGVSIVAAGLGSTPSAPRRGSASSPGPSTREDQPGIGAELPRAHRQRGRRTRLPIARPRAGQRRRQQQDRVDAAHLGIDRDRLGPRRPRSAPAPSRRRREPVKPDRLDPRIRDQRRADFAAGTEQQREHALRQAAFGDGAPEPRGPTSSDVPGWAECAFTTTGQPAASADAVSPPATENASGKLLAPNTATGPSAICRSRRSERGSGLRSGMAGSIRARASRPRARPRRTAGAGRRSGRARPRCRRAAGRSRHGALDQRVAERHELLGDRLEEAARSRARSRDSASNASQASAQACSTSAGVAAAGRAGPSLAGRRVDAADRGGRAPAAPSADQHFTSELHGALPCFLGDDVAHFG